MMRMRKIQSAVTFERWIERYHECNIDVRVLARDFFPDSYLMVCPPRKMVSNTQTIIYQNERGEISYLTK